MNKLFIIRHGQTFYNKAQKEWEDQGKALDDAEFRWDPELFDSPLNEDGVAQCESAVDYVHQLPIQQVFVSPLRRALQTCQILFKDHPLRPSITVDTALHEVLHNGHDISTYNLKPFDEYSHFNWSGVEKRFLPEIFMKECYKGEIIEGSFEEKNLKVAEIMKRVRPDQLESDRMLFERAQRSKESWRKRLCDGNLAIVTHSSFLRQFTKTEFEQEGLWLLNCEVREYIM